MIACFRGYFFVEPFGAKQMRSVSARSSVRLIAVITRLGAEHLLADREQTQHDGNETEGEQRSTQIVLLGFVCVDHECF
jgi:hypothetical protein